MNSIITASQTTRPPNRPQDDGGGESGSCLTLLVAAASVAIFFWPGAASWFEFDRAAVAAGEWWRVFTGHLTHFGFEHLLWDASVFAVLGVMCERRNRTATLACLGIAAMLIPAAVWLLMPDMPTYRGLSGLDTALFALLGGMVLREKHREGSRGGVTVICVLLLGMVAKIAWEFHTGGTIFVDSTSGQFVPVPLAHLVGAAVGLLVETCHSRSYGDPVRSLDGYNRGVERHVCRSSGSSLSEVGHAFPHAAAGRGHAEA